MKCRVKISPFDAPIKREGEAVFITDFGYVTPSKEISNYLKEIEDQFFSLKKKKKSTLKAKEKLGELERAVNVIAKATWAGGGMLKKI